VKLLFRPSEESGNLGAAHMVALGCMEDPKVNKVFGIHVDNSRECGRLGTKAGVINSASDHGVGGKDLLETEIFVKGTLSSTSSLIRNAASAAGGLVTVLRNPVSADYVAKHAALGALSHSVEIGIIICREMGNADAVVKALQNKLGIEELCRRVISDTSLNIIGGFDLGALTIDNDGLPITVTFWNEYMTAERDQCKERVKRDYRGKKIAVVVPDPGQVVHMSQRWKNLGINHDIYNCLPYYESGIKILSNSNRPSGLGNPKCYLCWS